MDYVYKFTITVTSSKFDHFVLFNILVCFIGKPTTSQEENSMSHPIARRAGMLALTAAMLMPSAGALSDVSNWAQEGVAAAQNAGL